MLAAAAVGAGVSVAFAAALALGAAAVVLMGVEGADHAVRQVVPTVSLAVLAAVGRVALAAYPDVKPVSAIAIFAGVALGRRSGFFTGAYAALLSNVVLGQGDWTPWQMYAWGLVGYVGGLVGETSLGRRRGIVATWGFVSGLAYGLVVNLWYIAGYVRPISATTVGAAFAAAIWLDCVHGLVTAFLLLLVWEPWSDRVRAAVERLGLRLSD